MTKEFLNVSVMGNTKKDQMVLETRTRKCMQRKYPAIIKNNQKVGKTF